MGFIERFVIYASQITDAPVEYYRACALFALAVTVDGRIRIRMPWGDIRPNLWVLLLGRSTVDRKTTCIEDITTPILMSNPSTVERIVATEATPEAFIEQLSERNPSRGFLVRDEVAGLLGSLGSKGYMEGMYEILMKMFDGPEVYTRRIRGGMAGGRVFTLNNVYFSILSGTTYQRLEETAGKTDVLSGFLPRFLIIPHDGARSSGGRGARTEEDDQRRTGLQTLLLALDRELRLSELSIDISPEGLEEYFQWRKRREEELANGGSDVAGVVFGRMATYVLKLAILDAVSAGLDDPEKVVIPKVITAEQIGRAICTVEALENRSVSLFRRIAADSHVRQKEYIFGIINKAGAIGIPRHELLSVAGIKRSTLDEAAETLVEEHRVVMHGGYNDEPVYISTVNK